MARLPRVVVVDVPHHVTQRGNARQAILASEGDRIAYIELLRHYAALYRLSLRGYCLMSNHVHLIAVPRAPDALAQTLKHTHGRYASYGTPASRPPATFGRDDSIPAHSTAGGLAGPLLEQVGCGFHHPEF
jgi:putative transposase